MRDILKVQAVSMAIISALCLLSSCGSHPSPPRQHRGADAAIAPVVDRLRGSWISHDYEQNLLKTHSPLHSAPYLDGIFSFIIDPANASQDTIYFSALVKGHDEDNLWIALGKRDSAGRYSAGQKNDDPKSENLIKARIDSQYIVLYTVSDSIRYIYYDGVYRNRANDYMLRHYTTTVLFQGEYTTMDSDLIFGSTHIAFDPVRIGRITGSPLYDSFDINIDVLAQKDTVDYMELFDTRGISESHSYTYTISKKNNIRILPLQGDGTCYLTRYLHQDTLAH